MLESYNSIRGKGSIVLVVLTVVVDIVILFLAAYINSYLLLAFFRVFLVVFNIYQLYYILLCSTIKYNINDDEMILLAFKGLKEIRIPFNSIINYNKVSGEIDGIRLSGFGKSHFALGKFVINKMGLVNMFVTSNKNIFYIKTKENVIAISPDNYKKFEAILRVRGIQQSEITKQEVKLVSLYRDKKFIIPFIIVAIIIIILTLNPFVLYLENKLPARMPISFNPKFVPVKYGTGKQFAFKQMMYGAYNMAILFCMYYAAYFNSKYDRKSSYKYVYISLMISAVFLFIQLKVLALY